MIASRSVPPIDVVCDASRKISRTLPQGYQAWTAVGSAAVRQRAFQRARAPDRSTNNPAVCKLQRIVMLGPLAKIDLAEARQSVLDGPAELLALNICILFKSDFGSWTKANGRRRIERGRAAGPCAEKFCGDKSFRKLDRPRSDQAQAQSHILRSSFERPRPMSVTSRGQARSRVASGHSQSRTIEADLNKRGRYDRPISGAMLPALWRR
jgi:hypothetical protein